MLRKRRDFLAAARASRAGADTLVLQARPRSADEPVERDLVRVGYTCSKKLGNAPTRNRAKRRLREAARAVLSEQGRPGWDYVLIGRPEATAARPYAELLHDLARALRRVHAPKAARRVPESAAR